MATSAMGSPLDKSASSMQVLRKEFEHFVANSGMSLSGNKGKMMDTFLLSLGSKIEALRKSIPQDLKEVKRMESEVANLQAKCDKSFANIEYKKKLIEETREQIKSLDGEFNQVRTPCNETDTQIRIATRDLLLTANKKASSIRRRPNTVDMETLTERIPLPNAELLEQRRVEHFETKPDNTPPEAIRKSTHFHFSKSSALSSRQGVTSSPIPPPSDTTSQDGEQSKLPPLGKSTASIKKKTRMQQSPTEEHVQQS